MNDITGVVKNEGISRLQDSILINIINPILAVATAVALVLFLIGIVRFMISRTTNPEETEKGKKHILWGGLALFIMASIWSVLIFIGSVFDSKIWFIK